MTAHGRQCIPPRGRYAQNPDEDVVKLEGKDCGLTSVTGRSALREIDNLVLPRRNYTPR